MDIMAVIAIIQAATGLYDDITTRLNRDDPTAPVPPTIDEVVAKARDLNARFAAQEDRAAEMLAWLKELQR